MAISTGYYNSRKIPRRRAKTETNRKAQKKGANKAARGGAADKRARTNPWGRGGVKPCLPPLCPPPVWERHPPGRKGKPKPPPTDGAEQGQGAHSPLNRRDQTITFHIISTLRIHYHCYLGQNTALISNTSIWSQQPANRNTRFC